MMASLVTGLLFVAAAAAVWNRGSAWQNITPIVIYHNMFYRWPLKAAVTTKNRGRRERNGKAQKRSRTGPFGRRRRACKAQPRQLLRTRLSAHRRSSGQLRIEAGTVPDRAGTAGCDGVRTHPGT